MLKNFLWFFMANAVLFLASCSGQEQTTVLVYKESQNVRVEETETPCTADFMEIILDNEYTEREEQTENPAFYSLVESGEKFRILQLHEAPLGYFRYEIINNAGELIYYTDTAEDAWFEQISEDILQFSVMHNSGRTQIYFFSEASGIRRWYGCGYPFFLKDEIAASFCFCCGGQRVLVQNIFDEHTFFAQFYFMEFIAGGADVMSDTSIVYRGNGEVEITNLRDWDGENLPNITFSLPPIRERHRYARTLDDYKRFARGDFLWFDDGLFSRSDFVYQIYQNRRLFYNEGRCHEFIRPALMYAFDDINGDGRFDLLVGYEQIIKIIYACEDGRFAPTPIFCIGSHSDFEDYYRIRNSINRIEPDWRYLLPDEHES